ncbi:MAG: TonB-dependent receptor domain-containing protein [Mucilaginibacter sp.]
MKNLTLKRFVFLLPFILSAVTVRAQIAKPQISVSGSLIDEKNKPVDFAAISLLRMPDSTIVKGTLTSETGVFAISNIAAGTYVIRASNIGYHTLTSEPFLLSESSSVTIPPLKMSVATQTLNVVTISASRPLIERKSDRTIMNVANSVLASGNSGLEILARAPGVTLDKDDNISLKGKRGVTVMLNDKLTYLSPAQLTSLLRSTDGNTIQSIEIISNPSAKYDAAGNSGIINIKLKKNHQAGTNGTVTIGTAYGRRWYDDNTFSLNHKEDAFNIFATFSHNDNKLFRDINTRRIVTDDSGIKTYFNQESTFPATNHNNSYQFGADYDMNKRNNVGFLVNGYFNSEFDDNLSTTYIGAKPGEVDSYQITTAQIPQTYRNFSVNLNDKFKVDTTGQELTVDFDYSKINNNADAQYNTGFFLPGGSAMSAPAILKNQLPSVITIHAAKLDYVYPLANKLKLEIGAKYSNVKTDNDLQAQKQINGNYVNDATLTNHFVYTEKLEAAYLNLNKSFEKTTVQLGLRSEHTDSQGELYTQNQVVHRGYLDFFPSVFINHTIDEKNEIGISYGRRIDRPNYEDLNPFIYYIDSYTSGKGNPFLNPQYSNNFELNYTYNKTINLSIGYSQTSDVITQLLLTDPVTKAVVFTSQNLQKQSNYNVNASSPFTITKWWTGDINATAFYVATKSNSLLGGNLNNGKVSYLGQLTQSFQLDNGTKAEFMMKYESASIYGIDLIKSHYSNDVGISHTFSDKRSNLKFSVSDVFNTRREDLTSRYQTNDIEIRGKFETRIARLTFTYNFGSSQIKRREHVSGTDDIKGRVKGAN